MDEAGCHHSRGTEDRLLSVLVENIQGLQTARCYWEKGMEGKRSCTAEEPCAGEGGQGEPGSEERTVNPAGSERKDEGMGEGERSAGGKQWKERECKQRMAGVLRELSVVHADKVSAWRGALRAAACMFSFSPPGGDDQQLPTVTGTTQSLLILQHLRVQA